MKEPTIDEEQAEQILEETTVEIQGTKRPLSGIVKDIRTAHRELDEYKSGSLALSQAIDERRMEAKQKDDEVLVDLLDDLKDSAYGVYLRLQRGDLEMLGERDGKHSGYFADE